MARDARRCVAGALLLALVLLASRDAAAANKEHQQMMADIRMLQEQAQLLQVQLAALAEALKAISTKMDEQSAASRKAFADQKLLVDAVSGDLRVVREKVDDNNLRIGSVAQELEALRTVIPQGVPSGLPVGDPQATGDPAAQPAQPAAPPLNPGVSPERLYNMAWADYAGGEYTLAIQGFETYIKTFPKSSQAGDAQHYIGETYYVQGKYREAVTAYDRVIADFANTKMLPDTYYKRGQALYALGQVDRARESWEFVVKTYPNSDAGRLARQRLDQLQRKDGDE
jgi:tol-pal system protein YbgF